MRTPRTALPLLALVGLTLTATASAAPNPCADGNCTVRPPHAWAQVSSGIGGGTGTPLAYPRRTQGAMLRQLTLDTAPAPSDDPAIDQGEPIFSCATPTITGLYGVPGGGTTTLVIGGSAIGQQGCEPVAPANYRCRAGRLAGATHVLTCTGPKGRTGIAWSGPSWGYWLAGPVGFPVRAMALSTR